MLKDKIIQVSKKEFDIISSKKDVAKLCCGQTIGITGKPTYWVIFPFVQQDSNLAFLLIFNIESPTVRLYRRAFLPSEKIVFTLLVRRLCPMLAR